MKKKTGCSSKKKAKISEISMQKWRSLMVQTKGSLGSQGINRLRLFTRGSQVSVF